MLDYLVLIKNLSISSEKVAAFIVDHQLLDQLRVFHDVQVETSRWFSSPWKEKFINATFKEVEWSQDNTVNVWNLVLTSSEQDNTHLVLNYLKQLLTVVFLCIKIILKVSRVNI